MPKRRNRAATRSEYRIIREILGPPLSLVRNEVSFYLPAGSSEKAAALDAAIEFEDGLEKVR